MLELPHTTLLSIDTINPLRTIRAMRYSLLQVKFTEAVLVTSESVFKPEMIRTIGGRGRIDQIRVVFVPQGPRTDYERQIIVDLPKWFTTEFCLFQEWDAAVMNSYAWKPEWFWYDYIGAPWPYEFHETGYPPCTVANCVGNGGFSLRRKSFCEYTAEVFAKHSSPKEALKCSDAWICRTIRQALEQRGFTFAPEDEAARFSCENRFYNGQFGIHGKNTISMNGWNWDFEWLK